MKGAKANASLYSLVKTTKVNGLEPYEYIDHLLTVLPHRLPGSDFSDLMPWYL
ncbi:MAG: transposase domain-containing protein [Gammaproteobacteria bacterium]|nr:transposase domain-containing protein [Gammaproteobacteria bacterium]